MPFKNLSAGYLLLGVVLMRTPRKLSNSQAILVDFGLGDVFRFAFKTLVLISAGAGQMQDGNKKTWAMLLNV